MLANRPGFGGSPALARGDFESEAPLFAELLGEGAHLVGHSYGAVIALYAAALRPDAVRSLTISEPGCLQAAAGDPRVDAQIEVGEHLFRLAPTMQPLEFLRAFRGGVGSSHETPAELSGELLQGAQLLMRERPPWESEPPLEALRAASVSEARHLGRALPGLRGRLRNRRRAARGAASRDRRPWPHDPGGRGRLQRTPGRFLHAREETASNLPAEGCEGEGGSTQRSALQGEGTHAFDSD